VIIPALDEEATIGDVVRAIPRDLAATTIVVDNGSRDATAERAREAGALVVCEPRRGYGRACAAGVRALPQSCGIVVFLDGDGSDDAAAMERLVAPVRAGLADFTIGSRTRGTREPGSMTQHQLLAGRIAGIAIAFAYGVRYTDMCPFRAIVRARLEALGMREETYGWNVEMQVLAAREGLRVVELPVDHRNRRGGSSKVSGSVSATLVAAARILTVLARAAVRSRRPR